MMIILTNECKLPPGAERTENLGWSPPILLYNI
jgi:hypothetical protein